MLKHEAEVGHAVASAQQSSDGSAAYDGNSANPSTTSYATTSVHFPSSAPVAPKELTAEEAAAVEALPARSALLIAHTGPITGARFLLDGDDVTAGRHPDADIFLDDVTVSRKHARFVRNDQGYAIVDAGSLNGTYINGDRVDSVQLRHGSEVQIGKFRLTFYNSANV